MTPLDERAYSLPLSRILAQVQLLAVSRRQRELSGSRPVPVLRQT